VLWGAAQQGQVPYVSPPSSVDKFALAVRVHPNPFFLSQRGVTW
jgi:hypothetical protein